MLKIILFLASTAVVYCVPFIDQHRSKRYFEGMSSGDDDEDSVADKKHQMPKFYAEITGSTEHTFTFSLSYDKLFSNISFYEIVVLKLNRDGTGIPRLTKTDSMAWISIASFADEPRPETPYITARYRALSLPGEFTVGNEKHYGGFFNGRLQADSYFVVFLRGIVKEGFKSYHLVSDYISDMSNPTEPEFFFTQKPTNKSIIAMSIVLIIMAVTLTIIFITMIHNVGIFKKISGGVFQKQGSHYRYEELRKPKKTKKRRKTRSSKKSKARKAIKLLKTLLDPIQEQDETSTKRKPRREDNVLIKINDDSTQHRDVPRLAIGDYENIRYLSPDSTVPISNGSTPRAVVIKKYDVPNSPSTEIMLDTPRTYKGNSEISLRSDGPHSETGFQTKADEIAHLKGRMRAYRLLIAEKKAGRLPHDLDINVVLEGDAGMQSMSRHLEGRQGVS